MFYSSQLLSRKSPLGIVWLASHSEGRKLKRTQLHDFSIVSSCESIINPEAPLALRLSGQLLLGVVRIYSRKLAFLETDARNAIDGLQRKDGSLVSVDLPDGGIVAERSITLNRRNAGDAGANNVNMLFPSFDVSAGFSGGARTSTSSGYTLAEDISDVFGSTRWTGSEDRFANSDLFSTELERLRDAQVAVDDLEQNNNNLFMDDMMDAPLPELFEQPGSLMVDPGKTPRSVAGIEGDKGRGNLETVGMFEQQDDGWGYDDYGGMDDVMGDVDAALPSPATPDNHPSKKKKKLQLDEDIVLDEDEVKRLMRNRTSLVKTRGSANAADSHLSDADRRRLVSVSLDGALAWLFVEPKKSRALGEGAAAQDAGDGANEQADRAEQPAFQDFGYDDYGGDHEDYFEDPLMGSLPLTPVQETAELAAAAMPADGFTARTQSVLKQMRERGNTVSLNALVENKSRLEACRWFFESLVLRNKGYVDLEQREPYGDIEIVML
jgi:cohesin complex subunit SCC1